MICDFSKDVKEDFERNDEQKINTNLHEEMKIDIIQQEVKNINDTIQKFKYELNKINELELANEKNAEQSEILNDKVRVLL